MRTSRLVVALLAVVLTNVSLAQTRSLDLSGDGNLVRQLLRKAGDRERDLAIAEDMQTLAAIVRENMEVAFRRPALTKAAEFCERAAEFVQQIEPLSEPLVEYLPGHGIVIQLKIPAPSVETAKDTDADREPVSRWQETRNRLRGKPAASSLVFASRFKSARCTECHVVAPPEKLPVGVPLSSWGRSWSHAYWNLGDASYHLLLQPAPTKSSLVHALVETLAENGHNIRGLKPDERVTISLSYSAIQQPKTEPAEQPGNRDESGDREPNDSDPDNTAPSDTTTSDEANVEPVVDASDELTSSRFDRDLFLSDIAWKELARRANQDGTNNRAERLRRLCLDLLGRLPTVSEARVFLADDSPKADQRLVDRLLQSPERRDYYSVRAAAERKGASARMPMPSRLSVSATKQQLDDVAAEQLSPIEFMQQARLRLFEPR